jgi:signal transduction histidine kinase
MNGNQPAVLVIIADNGPGMNPEQQRRAFEPFFTTKQRGCGLGLAICRRLIEAHNGTIELASSSPAGTEFMITLPRSPS